MPSGLGIVLAERPAVQLAAPRAHFTHYLQRIGARADRAKYISYLYDFFPILMRVTQGGSVRTTSYNVFLYSCARRDFLVYDVVRCGQKYEPRCPFLCATSYGYTKALLKEARSFLIVRCKPYVSYYCVRHRPTSSRESAQEWGYILMYDVVRTLPLCVTRIIR